MNILWGSMIIIGVIYSFFNGVPLTEAVISSGKGAVDMAITMLGIVPIWCGMLNIAEKAGITAGISKILDPAVRRLFPEIPKGHKSLEYISSNITANMLGLGWAATPSGVEAMKSLSALNGKSAEASASMRMFMVINMSSVQLITINIIAYRSNFSSDSPSEIILPGIAATVISTAVGIIAVKLCERRVKKCR